MHTVIVGGGFAGVKTALELSKKQLGQITLISDEPYFVHHATLYQVATGRDAESSVISLKDIFASNHDVTVVQDRMKSVDSARKTVVCSNAKIKFDELVIAIGTVTDYFGIEGLKQHSFGIATLDQVRQLKHHIHDDVASNQHADKTYVIVGGGLTGVELAGALGSYLREIARAHDIVRMKMTIMLVEKESRLVPHLSKTASKKITTRLKKLGVKIITNHRIESLTKDFVTVNGKRISTKTVVWASGSQNNPFFTQHPHDYERDGDGRIIVNQYLETSESVHVLGDNAAVAYAGHAQTALNEAIYIADHLKRKTTGQGLKGYHPRPIAISVPIGEKWAYVEKYGVYADGKTGFYIHRLSELRRLMQLLPRNQAMSAWHAENVHDSDCDLCDV
jgi:NADH dehydrogenase FAD-containing subunit